MNQHYISKGILIIVISQFISNAAYSQEIKNIKLDTIVAKQGFVNLLFHNKKGQDSLVDLSDAFNNFFNIKEKQKKLDSSNSSKTHYSILPGILYSLNYGWAALFNANEVLKQSQGSINNSNIFLNGNYTQKKQIVLQGVTNLWTKNDLFNIATNWSYLKYPQQDFGMGGYSSENLVDQLDYSYLKLYQTVSRKIAQNLYVGLGLNFDLRWNITDTSTMNKPVYGFTQYGFTKQSNSTGWLLNLLYDNRVNVFNPNPNSSFLNIQYRDNITLLGSDTHWQSLLIDARKYLRFPANSSSMFAFWTYDLFTLQGTAPYLDLPTLGLDTYNNTGRGYIQARYKGDKMLYFETEYRFKLTENGLFGGVLFANAESFSEPLSKQFKVVSPAYGLGIRIKLNKKSNTNLCIDYGFGTNGSKGLFMNLGEVF